MTIQFVRAAHGGGTAASGTTLTIPFDATGVDAIVVAVRDIFASVVTGMTYNGVPMTLARHDGVSGGLSGTTMYVGTGPTTGTNNVVISFNTSTNIGAVVAGFSGVNQASPVGNVAGKALAAGGSPFSQAITVAAGNLAVDFHVAKNDGPLTVAPTPVSPQVLADGFLATDAAFYTKMSYLGNATSMGWTLDGPNTVAESLSVIELKAAAITSTVTGVAVSPSTATVSGGNTQAFTASVAGTNSPSQAVTWTTAGGSINASGLFTAPAATGSVQTITVTATSTQDGTKSGTATVTVPAAASTVTGVTVSPATATVTGGATQTFTASVAGTNSPSQAVTWSTTAGTITAGGVLTAPATTTSAQTITVTATSTQDGTKSGTATVTVPADASTVTSVTVSPSSATGSQTFTATVAGTGSPPQTVTWATTAGTISAGGVFTAPAATGSVQTITVTATSTRDPSKSGTATVTIAAATAGNTLSPYFLSIRGQSNNYADRVKGAVTAVDASTGTLTLSGSASTGFQAFATAFTVGTARIPYMVEDAAGNWESRIGTLASGTTLTRDAILASSNGGAAVAFAAGAVAYCTITAAAIKRFAVKSYIDLRDYPVDPTFTTDSTAGIQAAINDAMISGVQTIRVPEGRYKIAGPVQTVDIYGRGCNGQLIIPASDYNASMRSVRIIGEGAPNWAYGAINDEPVVGNGVIFESTLSVTSGANPAVIAAATGFPGAYANFNFTDFTLENVCVRTNTINGANKMGGIDLYNLSNGGLLNNVRVDVNRGLKTNPSPATVDSTGIRTSQRDNSGMFKWGNVFVSGYNNAVIFSEHMCIDRLTVYGCTNAVTLQPAYHASWIGMLNVEGCKNSIVINGTHALSIGSYDTEHNAPGTFYDFAYDIKYVTGSRKVVILQSTVVVGGSGINDAAWATNATSANYKVVSGAGEN